MTPSPIEQERAQKTGTNKNEVFAVHREHPDWSAADIANYLDCMPEYVHATARRYQLVLRKEKHNNSRMRRSERSAALVDLGFLRLAIVKGDPTKELLRRVDDLVTHIREQNA